MEELIESLKDVQFVDTKKMQDLQELMDCVDSPLQSANIMIICEGGEEFVNIQTFVKSKRTTKDKVKGFCIFTKSLKENFILREESKVKGVYGKLKTLQCGIVEFLSNYQYKIEKANLKQLKKHFAISNEEENLKEE